MTALHRELTRMLKKAPLHWIGGRMPKETRLRHGQRETDKSVTLCITLTLRDRDCIVRALRGPRP